MRNKINTPDLSDNSNLHSDPALAAEGLSFDIAARFFEKVNKTKTCWLWTGFVGGICGQIARGGGKASGYIAIRKLSWLIHFGAMPPANVKSACGNGMCVNPTHFALKPGLSVPQLDDAAKQRAQTLTILPKDQDPTLPEGFSRNFRQRFWDKVNKNGANGCWIWIAAKDSSGYGSIGYGGKGNTRVIGAHQASWIMHFGPVPEGKEVMHNCPDGTHGNPACVNPSHLLVDTHKRNLIDAVEKDTKAGRVHWNSKISSDAVRAIRAEAAGGKTKHQIAEMFGITPSEARNIISGYRHSRIV